MGDGQGRRERMSEQFRRPPIKVNDFDGAPAAEHNQWCHVCWVKPAVLLLNTGVFQPCDRCQHRGWALIRWPRWITKHLNLWKAR